jgi:peroxiredoxin
MSTVSLGDLASAKGLVVIFMCNHCPFVKHLRSALAKFGRECQELGLAVVGISSNDVATHPDDGPKQMAEEHRSAGYTFPYLYDADQSVAKTYKAASGLSRTIRFQSTQQRSPCDRRRPASRNYGAAGWAAAAVDAASEHWL